MNWTGNESLCLSEYMVSAEKEAKENLFCVGSGCVFAGGYFALLQI